MPFENSLFDWQDCETATVNLTERGLTPVLALFSTMSHANNKPQSVIPLLSGKILTWRFSWQGCHEQLSTVFIKLATGNRINHCHLKLTLWQVQFGQLIPVSQAHLDGPSVADNQLNPFLLTHPLPPGQYWCELSSPDADNADNTLFIWLTLAEPYEVLTTKNLFPLLDYGLMPIMSFSAKTGSYRAIETTLPLLKEHPHLQWPLEWFHPAEPAALKFLFLKLATGGRQNHCELILTIWQPGGQQVVSTATVVGHKVRDTQWTRFTLNPPLQPGRYHCELYSPDTDETNALFIWVTVAYPELARLKQSVATALLQDLSAQGLIPLLKIHPLAANIQPVTQSIALLREHLVQWSLDLTQQPLRKITDFQAPAHPKFCGPIKRLNLLNYQTRPIKQDCIKAIWLKIGTGGRVNQCHLNLLILQETDSYQTQVVAKASLAGASIVDNQWNEFVLDQPLLPGQYWGQLFSPDTDNIDDVLFVNLTTAEPAGFVDYHYQPSPSLTTTLQFAQLTQLPQFNIVILHFAGKPVPYWRDCLNSIVKQIYPYWEIWLITSDENLLQALPHYSHRLHLLQARFKQTAAALYNHALAEVRGEYTLFLSLDDLLTPDALLTMADELNHAPLDMLYSDEDYINQAGAFTQPFFKPAWSPELLYQQHYTGQLTVYRHELLQQIGGFREQFSSQALWDLALRFSEQAQGIQHVAKILYHRRLPQASTLNDAGYTSNLAFIEPTALLKVAQAALNRQGYDGQITLNPKVANTGLLHYPVKGSPLVSIIIPTKDRANLLARCLDSLRLNTTYLHWEIVIVDNGSSQPATFELFEKYQQIFGKALTVTVQNIPFNFAKLVNEGVKVAQGEIIFLLNNDTELVNPHDWLSEMVGFAQCPPIGAVGCRLHYPQDNTIQHAGLICGIGGIANYSHKHFPGNSLGYYNRLAVVANYSAITGAALMVRRELWDKVNGFDEALAVAFNDVDFSLKLLAQGLRHVVLPQVIFYHHESKSRGLENTAEKRQRFLAEARYMKQRWGKLLEEDRFYNPHLTHTDEDFSLARDSIYYQVSK